MRGARRGSASPARSCGRMPRRSCSIAASRRAPFSMRLDRRRGVLHALGLTFAYAAFVSAIRLIVVTFITYLQMATHSRFQDISEAYSANELMVMGVAALLFVMLLRFLNPITSTTTEEVFTGLRFEKK